MNIIRTTSDNPDFQTLADQLSAELRVRDGDLAEHYAQLNRIGAIAHTLVAYVEEIPVGCGALRPYEATRVELKRMYVDPSHRGKGIASAVLSALEAWARELAFDTCVLETGRTNPEAIAMYKKYGYREIPLFGRYVGSENSICFEKKLC